MSAVARFILILIAIVAIALAALAVLVQTQLTPERVRSTFLPLVEKQLGRTVDVGDINIGIFSGVSISQLTIYERQSPDPFVTVDSVKLSYRLWALFKGDLAIREVLLDAPAITLIRYPDGTFNFSDFFADEQAGTISKSGNDRVPSVMAAPFDLLIQRTNIRNGQLLFIDQRINPAAPFRYRISNMNLSVKDMSLAKSFPVEMALVLNQAQVTLSAQIDLSQGSGNAVVRLSPLDLIPFAPYYRDQLPGSLGSAQLEVNIDLEWTTEHLVSRGRIALNQVDLVLRDMADMPLRGVQLTTDYAVSYDYLRELFEVSTAVLNFNDIRTMLQGYVDLSAQSPTLDLDLKLDSADLRHSLQSLPQALTRKLHPYSPAGVVSARLRLAGSVDSGTRLIHSAQVQLKDLQATLNNIRVGAHGDINFTGKGLQADNLALRAGDQQVRLAFDLEEVLASPITGTFSLSSRELDLNKFLFDDERSGTAGVSSASDEPGPYHLPFHLAGAVNIERLLYRQLTMQQINAAVELKDNRLTVSPLNGRMNAGQFNMTTSIDLGVEGFAYQGQVGLTQPDMSTLVSGLFPASRQNVSGQVNWLNSFSGHGTITRNLLQALQLDGEIQLSQGGLSGFELLNQVSWFLDSPDLKDISFRDFHGVYHLRDGKAQIDSQLDGSQVNMKPQGTVGIDGSVSLSLTTRLAPDVLSRMGAAERLKQAFVDHTGWGVLPLQIGGSLTRPTIGFDTQALEQQAMELAKEEAADILLDKVLPEAQEQSKGSLRDMLDNTLQRLRSQ